MTIGTIKAGRGMSVMDGRLNEAQKVGQTSQLGAGRGDNTSKPSLVPSSQNMTRLFNNSII